MDFPHIQGLDAVRHAGGRCYRRLAVGISETQAAKNERRQKIMRRLSDIRADVYNAVYVFIKPFLSENPAVGKTD